MAHTVSSSKLYYSITLKRFDNKGLSSYEFFSYNSRDYPVRIHDYVEGIVNVDSKLMNSNIINYCYRIDDPNDKFIKIDGAVSFCASLKSIGEPIDTRIVAEVFDCSDDETKYIYTTYGCSEMPTASEFYNGCVFEYTGRTMTGFTHGLVYECYLEGGTYKWGLSTVLPSGGEEEGEE